MSDCENIIKGARYTNMHNSVYTSSQLYKTPNSCCKHIKLQDSVPKLLGIYVNINVFTPLQIIKI